MGARDLAKGTLKQGDIIEITTREPKKIRGTMLQEKEGFVIVKLENGYNAGISISDIADIRKAGEGKKAVKAKAGKARQENGKHTIAVLHTGGTIASRVDYRTGAVFASFELEDLFAMFPELGKKARFTSTHLSNMWSDDMRFGHFSAIARAVEKEAKKGARGAIVGMGTDNMHYASCALAFMLENCPIPVLLVGAQRSSDRGSSDAAMNLDCAAEFILKTGFRGVAICMHDSTDDGKCAVLPPCKTRKMHSSRRDAFKAINDTPIALVDYVTKNIEFVKKECADVKTGGKFSVRDKMEEKVSLLKVHVNMQPEEFSFYRGYKGLVIEGSGLGHTPGHVSDSNNTIHRKIFPAIKSLAESGCIVVMTTQCIYGRVGMNVYSKGKDLQDLGVIPGEDMLAETAFIKLSWLLANRPEEAKTLVGKNMRGEIGKRTCFEEKFEPF